MKKIGRRVKIPQRVVTAFLTFLAALLTFGGPTYIMYTLESLGVPYLLYLLLGLAFFAAGVILFMYLFKEKTGSKKSS
ncbi:MAG: hypothetical protein JSW53_04745 [Candidatus Bathyarchaeota archaeon]|nr:MAG: hypothetical protein JSW53_04745 [Candidatus Bathyarchaeota archaeon]